MLVVREGLGEEQEDVEGELVDLKVLHPLQEAPMHLLQAVSGLIAGMELLEVLAVLLVDMQGMPERLNFKILIWI